MALKSSWTAIAPSERPARRASAFSRLPIRYVGLAVAPMAAMALAAVCGVLVLAGEADERRPVGAPRQARAGDDACEGGEGHERGGDGETVVDGEGRKHRRHRRGPRRPTEGGRQDDRRTPTVGELVGAPPPPPAAPVGPTAGTAVTNAAAQAKAADERAVAERKDDRAGAADSRDARQASDPVVKALLQGARSPDAATRLAAARALAQLVPGAGDDLPGMAEALESLLRDPDAAVATAAARGLVHVAGANGALSRRLNAGDAPGAVHLACLEGLAAVGDAQDLEGVLAYVHQGDGIQEPAVWAAETICARTGAKLPKGIAELAEAGAAR